MRTKISAEKQRLEKSKQLTKSDQVLNPKIANQESFCLHRKMSCFDFLKI
jgi:hypothetical protein